MKPQPVSFFEPKKRKKSLNFSPVSRETGLKKKVRFLAKTNETSFAKLWNHVRFHKKSEVLGRNPLFFFLVSFTWNWMKLAVWFQFFWLKKWNWLWFHYFKGPKLWNRQSQSGTKWNWRPRRQVKNSTWKSILYFSVFFLAKNWIGFMVSFSTCFRCNLETAVYARKFGALQNYEKCGFIFMKPPFRCSQHYNGFAFWILKKWNQH